ncbi:MAG: hypothetical protein BAJATHORv1_20163 [Candidatus Thorarchaeota archaeon]|nr:MAG: hypothetical protein BAJATHORv1_20163 [Candidatus Thorarchaeota archaeon]
MCLKFIGELEIIVLIMIAVEKIRNVGGRIASYTPSLN